MIKITRTRGIVFPTKEQIYGLYNFLYALITTYPNFEDEANKYFSDHIFWIPNSIPMPEILPTGAKMYFSSIQKNKNNDYWGIKIGSLQTLLSHYRSYLAPLELWNKIEQILKISENEPIDITPLYRILGYGSSSYWMYKGNSFYINGDVSLYAEDEISLLILNEYDKERKKFENLRRKFTSSENAADTYARLRIPEQVRIEVWRRDGGKCAKCGSREYLEYDHIVPISKGGSNTARNIELLCEKCNRSKGANIE